MNLGKSRLAILLSGAGIVLLSIIMIYNSLFNKHDNADSSQGAIGVPATTAATPIKKDASVSLQDEQPEGRLEASEEPARPGEPTVGTLCIEIQKLFDQAEVSSRRTPGSLQHFQVLLQTSIDKNFKYINAPRGFGFDGQIVVKAVKFSNDPSEKGYVVINVNVEGELSRGNLRKQLKDDTGSFAVLPDGRVATPGNFLKY